MDPGNALKQLLIYGDTQLRSFMPLLSALADACEEQQSAAKVPKDPDDPDPQGWLDNNTMFLVSAHPPLPISRPPLPRSIVILRPSCVVPPRCLFLLNSHIALSSKLFQTSLSPPPLHQPPVVAAVRVRRRRRRRPPQQAGAPKRGLLQAQHLLLVMCHHVRRRVVRGRSRQVMLLLLLLRHPLIFIAPASS